ncbi:similar to Saccharomyces cerevisiae YDR391C Putative protein of unknown function, possibly involved in zinc homeostasis [Maudiozyma saulgeensis]|uniref:N-acetyltransferase domain-containing protein n=1 Tax=Maudiozyma saulgeensis TaxID=1789683 RepID=A0A1X7R2X6_9SACH|nr:similar to Saccharomyces cerevisiae YDR391C Putative protein of unknown function, possibly involved in zinc homeostasis [Kazachstania saulgeensis]
MGASRDAMAAGWVVLEVDEQTGNWVKRMEVARVSDIGRACKTLLAAFHDSRANDFINCKFQDVPLQKPLESQSVADKLTENTVMFYHERNAELVYTGDYSTVAIWTVPGHHVDVGRTKDETFNSIFLDESQKIKETVIPKGMDYYYLFMIGRDPESHEKGTVRAMFDHYINRANVEKCALVLEAISEHAREVYEHFGFVNYNTFHYGVGEVNSLGQLDPHGEGHTGYLMIYLPKD